MAKKGDHRIKLGFTCTICKNRNYVSEKNKLNTTDKLLLNKFCKFCKKVTTHKETERLK